MMVIGKMILFVMVVTSTDTDKNEEEKLGKYSIDPKCTKGTAFDSVFGECLPCNYVFNCEECDDSGCKVCDDGSAPMDGRCNKGK